MRLELDIVIECCSRGGSPTNVLRLKRSLRTVLVYIRPREGRTSRNVCSTRNVVASWEQSSCGCRHRVLVLCQPASGVRTHKLTETTASQVLTQNQAHIYGLHPAAVTGVQGIGNIGIVCKR